MNRYLHPLVQADLPRKLVLLTGPRQVGKTTLARQLGQAVVYVVIFAGSVAVLGEVYGDLLRAAGASERLMELLALQSPVQSPAQPVSAARPAGGSALRFEGVGFRYPSRPAQRTLHGSASLLLRCTHGAGHGARRGRERALPSVPERWMPAPGGRRRTMPLQARARNRSGCEPGARAVLPRLACCRARPVVT